MSHAIFSGIPVVAIGLALSVELKVYWAMIGHDEQLFRWVWCRKTPASEIQGRTQTPLHSSLSASFQVDSKHDPSLAPQAVYESHAKSVLLVPELNPETKNTN